MKSSAVGSSILSNIEVLNISKHGFWLYLMGKEYFLTFEDFPWFKVATISQILNVDLLHDTHLYWPALDVDLGIESIEFPEKYPLVYE